MPQPRFCQSWHRSSTQPGWNLPFKTSFGDHLQGSPGDENDNDKYKVFQTGMYAPPRWLNASHIPGFKNPTYAIFVKNRGLKAVRYDLSISPSHASHFSHVPHVSCSFGVELTFYLINLPKLFEIKFQSQSRKFQWKRQGISRLFSRRTTFLQLKTVKVHLAGTSEKLPFSFQNFHCRLSWKILRLYSYLSIKRSSKCNTHERITHSGAIAVKLCEKYERSYLSNLAFMAQYEFIANGPKCHFGLQFKKYLF